MTIGKKLYVNFGIILTMVVVLFIVNLLAVHREHDAKDAASASLKLADATNDVRFQMMPEPPIPEGNYLLSGDSREVDRMNDGPGARSATDCNRAGSWRIPSKSAPHWTGWQQLEESWSKEFAHPLIDKREGCGLGNATVAELQIYYLQKDASSWVKNSTDALDVADSENRKLVEEGRKSDERASTWTIMAAIVSTLVALGLGVAVAFRTAKASPTPDQI